MNTKNQYQKPTISVVQLQQRYHLLEGSPTTTAPEKWGSQDVNNPYDFD
jgi:hypothetical protein